jgi:hypothetical protein
MCYVVVHRHHFQFYGNHHYGRYHLLYSIVRYLNQYYHLYVMSSWSYLMILWLNLTILYFFLFAILGHGCDGIFGICCWNGLFFSLPTAPSVHPSFLIQPIFADRDRYSVIYSVLFTKYQVISVVTTRDPTAS